MKRLGMKKFIIPIFLTVIGISFLSAFHIIGGRIDSNGYVIEPFALLPTGYALFLLGLTWLGSIFIKKIVIPISTMIIGITSYGMYHWIGVGSFVLSPVGLLLAVMGVSWSVIVVMKKMKTKFSRRKIANS